MVNENSSIAVVPSTRFKWTAEIQYKESLSDQDEAIRYASQHHCNLIVKYHKRTGPLFDVMNDPGLSCATQIDEEAIETVPAVFEPESTGWSKLVLRSVFGLAKRIGGVPSNTQRNNAMTSAHAMAAK